MAAVDGRGEFAFHTQLRAHEDETAISEAQARAMFEAAVGARVPGLEILSRQAWTTGYALVAERLQAGRVLLGGDAAHLFTPTGGLGDNTALDDAVNLGWKAGGDAERSGWSRPAGQLRRRAPAGGHPEHVIRARLRRVARLTEAEPDLEDDRPAGAAARRRAGEWLNAHARAELNIPGITFGARYDGSPVICPDGTLPPPTRASTRRP